MKTPTRFMLVAMLMIGSAAAEAQAQVTLQFRDAHVRLTAQNVPVRQILAEWARVGGTRVVSLENAPGAVVTLDLVDVPEREALDIVLRTVSGYVLMMRPLATPNVSAVDRILILPASAGPRNPPAVDRASAPGANQSIPKQVVRPPISAQVSDPPAEPERPGSDSLTDRQPSPPGITPVAPPRPVAAVPAAPPPQPPPTRPGNPFGVPNGSGLPGVVTPAPPAPAAVLKPAPSGPTPPPTPRAPASTTEPDRPR